MSLQQQNPFSVDIVSMTIEKFNGNDKINILPQFIEINIFQSIFSPLMRAELLVYDPIGLFTNYPLSGEEIIRVTYTQEGAGRIIRTPASLDGVTFPYWRLPASSDSARTLHFMITNVTNITPSQDVRSQTYMLNLVSVEMFRGSQIKVSESYNEPVCEAAKKLWDEYVYQPTRLDQKDVNFTKEFFIDREGFPSYSAQLASTENILVVPMLTPMQAMVYMQKHNVTQNPEVFSVSVFFENFYGYFFTTIQSLIADQIFARQELAERERFVYLSNSENRRFLTEQPGQQNRLISNVVTNKRLGSFDKMVGGYYSSEFYEINAYQRGYQSTRDDHLTTNFNAYMYPNKMNNDYYLEAARIHPVLGEGEERTPHTRYEIVNSDDANYQGRREKYNSSIKYLASLNQNDLHITVPGDMTHNVGELIHVEIPEMHGFNDIDLDKYLSGIFIVTEVKHTITISGLAATSMRINKDSYTVPLDNTMKYSLSGEFVPPGNQRPIQDPETGLPEGV